MKYLDIGAGGEGHSLNKEFNAKPEEKVLMDYYNLLPNTVKHDLLTFPYPFKDDEFDGVLLSHVYEHLLAFDGIKVLNEIHRILKPGGRVLIYCPHFSDMDGTANNLTHQRVIGYRTLDLACCNLGEKEHYSDKLFEMVEVRIVFNGWKNCIQGFVNKYPKVFERGLWRFLPAASEIRFELRKPE